MAGLIQQAMPQEQMPPQQGIPQGEDRQATPAEQGQFELVVKQALEFIGQEGNVKSLMDMVRKTGPEMALATFIKRTLDGIYTAAGEAGAQLQGHTMNTAAEIIAKILVQMLQASGLPTENPDAMVDAAMQAMESM